MIGTYNEYWESEEFEDLVASSLIGLYETRIKKSKKVPRGIRFNEKVFKRFKNIGCYFTPHDRVCSVSNDDDGALSFTQQIDIENDGLPDRAVFTTKVDNVDDAFLTSFYLERIPCLPKLWTSDIGGKFYRITQLFFGNNHVSADGTLLVIDKSGRIQSCYINDYDTDPTSGRVVHVKSRPIMEEKLGSYCDYYSAWGSIAIQFYQDGRHLWNVKAYDGDSTATFGIYPEQIQSLFYARDLPQTGSGRKRPILHWVQAHQRRMRSGTEIDIEKYLRGTHEFVMGGTQFKITNPMKGID